MSRDQDRQALIRELSDAIREHQNAVDAFDEAAAARLGVNRTDLRCMDVIDRAGRMTAGQLAVASGLTTGAVTALIDRMESAGYVSRLRDPDDRRRVLVELTPRARAAAEEIWGPIAAEASEEFGRWTDEELTRMRDFLRGGREVLARHVARIAPAAEDEPQPPRRAPGRRRPG